MESQGRSAEKTKSSIRKTLNISPYYCQALLDESNSKKVQFKKRVQFMSQQNTFLCYGVPKVLGDEGGDCPFFPRSQFKIWRKMDYQSRRTKRCPLKSLAILLQRSLSNTQVQGHVSFGSPAKNSSVICHMT